MEYFEGPNLAEHLRKVGRLSENGVSRVVRQLVEALTFCHEKGICHLDVKPENILVDQALRIKLIDFAFAVRQIDANKVKKYCGTAKYMAPEVMRKEIYDPQKADVWSVGIVAYRLYTGEPPFKGKDVEEIHKNIKEFNLNKDALKFAPHSLREFISKTLCRKPDHRLSMKEVASC